MFQNLKGVGPTCLPVIPTSTSAQGELGKINYNIENTKIQGIHNFIPTPYSIRNK